MRFGEEKTAEAEGTILAHSLRVGRSMLRKGHLLTRADLDTLAAAGIEDVTVARLDVDDVGESDAAGRIADALRGENVSANPPRNGRADLLAGESGIVALDPGAVDTLNAVAEEVTVATLGRWAPVHAGERVATIKIIPFAVSTGTLEKCLASADAARLKVLPFRPLAARLVQSVDEGLKTSIVEKTSMVTSERLARIGSRLAGEARCAHDAEAVARAMAAELDAKPDIMMVIGASAIVDRRDVIPAAIEKLGGKIERLGMPVEPGNLILTGEIGGVPVLGLPGCARSPARNGLDWVLERISAGIPVGRGEIGAMGVGGLLIGREDDKDYL
ncbi:MAG TPA: molybdopterin-binding protein [Alphaproteobacteria bacterium]|nr:molybdopterin-binding protein [Alphaproteobacteria bacterium]